MKGKRNVIYNTSFSFHTLKTTLIKYKILHRKNNVIFFCHTAHVKNSIAHTT